MIVVDTSVWIDYFNGRDTPQTDKLDALLGNEPLGIGDLILAEVLQGFRSDADFRKAKALLTSLTIFEMLGVENAIRSAEHYRVLRKRGITIRKTADVIIATFYLIGNHALLFSDRDFIPFLGSSLQLCSQLRGEPGEVVDEVQRVLDLVGDSRRERAQRGQLLLLDQLILRAFEFGVGPLDLVRLL